jgi:hypothetical protein
VAISKVTTRPSPAQVRAATQQTSRRRRRPARVLELPERPSYPTFVLQVTNLTSLELSFLEDIARRDGVDPAECSPSQRGLIAQMKERCLITFAERLNLWRLSSTGECCVRLAGSVYGYDIQLRPASMAKVLQFPRADRSVRP